MCLPHTAGGHSHLTSIGVSIPCVIGPSKTYRAPAIWDVMRSLGLAHCSDTTVTLYPTSNKAHAVYANMLSIQTECMYSRMAYRQSCHAAANNKDAVGSLVAIGSRSYLEDEFASDRSEVQLLLSVLRGVLHTDLTR